MAATAGLNRLSVGFSVVIPQQKGTRMKMGEFRDKTAILPDDAEIVTRAAGSGHFEGQDAQHAHVAPSADGKGHAVITYGDDKEYPHAL